MLHEPSAVAGILIVEEKLAIEEKELRRSTLDHHITQTIKSRKQSFKFKFNKNIHSKQIWLYGHYPKNKYFFYVCCLLVVMKILGQKKTFQ